MALSLKDLTKLLMERVPYKDTWMKEAYGPHHTRNHPTGRVERALYCVTPTPGVIQQFKDGKYDILLTHHPFVVGVPQWIAHTALDCTTGGLNDQWRDLFKLKNTRHFDGNLGWYGELERPHTLDELVKISENFVGVPLIGEHHGHEHPINSVVICTGLGGMVEQSAHKSGADCYILGEATKHHTESPFKARIEIGHTLSESITGLNFFRKHLEPHGIIVDQADLTHDKYSGEVYNRPAYNPTFSERPMIYGLKGTGPGGGLGGAPGRSGWGGSKNLSAIVARAGAGKRDLDAMFPEFEQPEPEGEPSEEAWPQDEEADFWSKYWAEDHRKKGKAADKPPGESKKYDVPSRGSGIQGVVDIPDKPPRPPGGDFPE